MKRVTTVALALSAAIVAGAAAPAVEAAELIKLATLAPDGSPWHQALRELSDTWRKQTDGRVELRIYPGGIAGDDADMVRKMRVGQLQAAALTGTGLSDIDEGFYFLFIPLFFESDAEFAYVLEKMTPTLSARLEAKGFVLLHWAHGGWVRFFSKHELHAIEDLKQAKIFAWAGDDNFVELWKSNGFRPVALAATDILTGLQTGMIDTLPSTPLAALSLQWFRQTPYLLDEPIAPLVGGTVITKKAWNGIDEADRRAMRAAAQVTQQRLAEEIPRKDEEAIAEMSKRGLTVLHLDPARRAGWTELARKFAQKMAESVPAAVYQEALGYRAEFRRQHGGEGTP